MKKLLGVCVLTLLAGIAPAQTISAQQQSRIRAVVQQYLDAREHGDARALAELFTSEADQLVSSGMWRAGREALVEGTLASSKSEGGRRTITLERIRLLTPDVAIADGRYELTGLANGLTRKMWSTFVLVQKSGKWRIAAIRNMLPAKPAPTR